MVVNDNDMVRPKSKTNVPGKVKGKKTLQKIGWDKLKGDL